MVESLVGLKAEMRVHCLVEMTAGRMVDPSVLPSAEMRVVQKVVQKVQRVAECLVET